jgi:hypothetical protein
LSTFSYSSWYEIKYPFDKLLREVKGLNRFCIPLRLDLEQMREIFMVAEEVLKEEEIWN